MVEAGIVQLQREQVFPVDPAANGLGRLPVAQPLAELHERDDREPPRRVRRPGQVRHQLATAGLS